MVDIDPVKLVAKGLTPLDVVNAVNAQNLTLPSGLAKIGDTQYTVRTNATPATIADLNNIPIKYRNGQTVFLKDVGQVHDGWAVQQNIVRENGRRSVLLSVIKNGNASTLAVVDGVRKVLKIARAAAPPGLSINELFDQSKLVTASIASVLREGAIAAGLTGLMILLFLGSWRSTLIVLISIPLSILTSIVVLYFLGDTLNTMTLGGMALAVGILVDDSTVTIENTHRLRGEGMSLAAATLHGSAGIAVPTLVSTLAISCVFTSVVFLEGPAKFLFTPLGLAVVFAMLASYALSRTLTPVIIGLLLKGEHHDAATRLGQLVYALSPGVRARLRAIAPGLCPRAHDAPETALDRPGRRRADPRPGRRHVHLCRPRLLPRHRRRPDPAPRPGARRNAHRNDRAHFSGGRRQDPRGHPGAGSRPHRRQYRSAARTYNLAFTDGSTIGVNDGVILVALKDGHAPTAEYVRKLREVLPDAFPSVTFYFQAADIVTQILNFGLPAQIDVRTVGHDRVNNLRLAHQLRRRIAAIPGIADAHLQQELDAPAFFADIDRSRASQLGLNAKLSPRSQHQPQFLGAGIAEFLDRSIDRNSLLPRRADAGHEVSSLNELGNTPVSTMMAAAGHAVPGLLSNVATFQRDSFPPTPTRPISSRSTTSMPACRAAISAASRPTSTSRRRAAEQL